MTNNDREIDGLQLGPVIGRGGSAQVYEAFDPRHGRRVAVKVLEMPELEDRRRRAFRRELQAMGRLGDHPHVVDVFDSGFTVDGAPYLVMPLIEGGTVAQRIRAGQAFSIEQVLDFGVKIGSALETAHRRGILHCDIKPSNLFLGAFSTPLLGDLGISSVSEAGLTTTSQLSLTIMYAAPEIIENEPHSAQSDIYSLGASIFALTDMTPPFTGDSTAGLIRNILAPEATPRLRRAVPDGLADLVAEMMALRPADRPQTALDVVGRFQTLQAELGLPVTEATVAAAVELDADIDAPTGVPIAVDGDTRSRPNGLAPANVSVSWGRWAAAGFAALLLAIVGFFAFSSARSSNGDSATGTRVVSAEPSPLPLQQTPVVIPTSAAPATAATPLGKSTEPEAPAERGDRVAQPLTNEDSIASPLSPVAEEPTAAATATPTPTPTPTAEPDESAARVGGAISLANGDPADGVTVDIFVQLPDGERGDYIESAETDSSGNFSFDLAEPGCYVLTYLAPEGFSLVGGDLFLNEPVCVDDGEPAEVGAELEERLPLETSIEVRVLRADTFAGISDAQVDVFLANDDGSRGAFVASGVTDANGDYRFDLATGCYVVTFVAPEGSSLVGGDEFLNESAGCLASGDSANVAVQVE